MITAVDKTTPAMKARQKYVVVWTDGQTLSKAVPPACLPACQPAWPPIKTDSQHAGHAQLCAEGSQGQACFQASPPKPSEFHNPRNTAHVLWSAGFSLLPATVVVKAVPSMTTY